MKKRLCILLVMTVFTLVLTLSACERWTNPGDNLGGGGIGDVATAVDTTAYDETKLKLQSKSDLSELSSRTAAEKVKDVVVNDNNVVEISANGTYVLSGNYSGVLFTKKGLDVHLIFDGVTIICDGGVAVDAQDKKDQTVLITLNEGTVNTVVNSGDDVNAIHVKGALSINGKGTLNVTSDSKSALKARDELQIVDATLNLNAANHAVAAMSVTAADCTINVTAAGKDGINSECYDETVQFTTDEGFVCLTNVSYTCDVQGDGIQADTAVYIDGGAYNFKTNGNFVEKTVDNIRDYGMSIDDFCYVYSGGKYQKVASDYKTSGMMYGLSQSCKGIKVGAIEYSYKDDDGNKVEGTVGSDNYLIAIMGGTFVIDSTDDAIHANGGNVLIHGGTLELSTYDDAITADNLTKITDGTINITSSYEGIEGSYVEISGGTVNVTATDDGINAASVYRLVAVHIIISGGNVTVNSGGDGIDSNGSILISGGVVTVHGPTSGGDAGLDADKGIVINGGTVFASSTLGMVETPSTNSTQYVVSYAHQSMITAGSVMSLRDKKGNVLIQVTVEKNCQSVIMSCAALQKGATYYIYGGDTKMTSFKVSSVITTIGTSGNSFPGGPGGGPGGPGGRR